MNSNNYKILYIFGSGRRNKIQKNSFDSSEFFYGYFYIKKKYKNTNYIEMLPEGEKLNTFQNVVLGRFMSNVLCRRQRNKA